MKLLTIFMGIIFTFSIFYQLVLPHLSEVLLAEEYVSYLWCIPFIYWSSNLFILVSGFYFAWLIGNKLLELKIWKKLRKRLKK